MKKKKLFLIPLAMFMAAGTVSLAGCGDKKEEEQQQPDDPVNPDPVDPVDPVVAKLSSIAVKTPPSTLTYVEGSEFSTAGLEIEATYSDGSKKTVTGWTVDKTVLALGDTKVVVSYTEGGVTKSADIAITVTEKEKEESKYGDEEHPLTVAEAQAILIEECAENNDTTKECLYVAGYVRSIKKVYDYTEGPSFEFYLSDGETDIYVYRCLGATEDKANFEVGSEVVIKAKGKNYSGTLEMCDVEGDKSTLLSVAKSTKTIASIDSVSAPAEVSQGASILTASVNVNVVFGDGLPGTVHPDSIDLDTSVAGEVTGTVHVGELTKTFVITVTAAKENKFAEAYAAAKALESGVTEEYYFEGVVIAKRGDDCFIQDGAYGIDVYKPTVTVNVGDKIGVSATLKNYNGMPETAAISNIESLGTATLPDAAKITSIAAQKALNISVLCEIEAQIKALPEYVSGKDYSFTVSIGAEDFTIFINKSIYASFSATLAGLAVGDDIKISNAVTGIFKSNLQVVIASGSKIEKVVHAVTGVSLDKETLTLEAGAAPATLVATVAPENATNKAVTWTSSNEEAATVEDGVVTPIAVGETTITVKTAEGGFEASCVVTITAATRTMIGITVEGPTKVEYTEGDALDLTGLVVKAVYDSGDPEVITAGYTTSIEDGATLATTDTSFTVSYNSFTSDPIALTVNEKGPIVAEGTYTIKHVKNGTAYYMVDPNAAKSPTVTTNISEATVFDFIPEENSLCDYKIKVHGENKYLSCNDANDGVRIGTKEAIWKIEVGTQSTGAYNISTNVGTEASPKLRYLTVFNTQDFRAYANTTTNRTENTDLESVVAKDVESIAIKQNPTKMTYYVGEAFDPTGMIVTVTYTDTTTEDITEGFTYEGVEGFEAAADDRTVKITYKSHNAYVQHVTVIEDERTLAGIEFAEGSDMTKKEYKEGESWDAAGLTVNDVYSDESREAATEGVTLAFNPAAPAVGVESVTVTATKEGCEPVSITITGITVAELPKNVDEISAAALGVTSGSYTSFNNVSLVSGAKYSGMVAKNSSNGVIQLTNAEKGLYSVESLRTLKSVSAKFNSNTTNDRYIEIYAKRGSFTSTQDIEGATKVATFTKTADATEFIYSFEDLSNYTNILIRASGAVYLDELTITWSESKADAVVFGVSLDSAEATVNMGESLTLNATVDGYGANYDKVTWESSDTSKVTVVDGVLTPVAVTEEPVTITATSVVDSTKSATCVISVASARNFTGLSTEGGFKTSYTEEDTDFAINDLKVFADYDNDDHEEITDYTVTWSTAFDKTVGNHSSIPTIHWDGHDLELSPVSYTVTEASHIKYSKVTAEQVDWSGTYVMLCENASGNYIFDRSITTDNNQKTAVELVSGKVQDPTTTQVITIEKCGDGYSIKLSDGKYLAGTGKVENKTAFVDNPYELNISYDADNGLTICTNETNVQYLRANYNGGSPLFRFYKEASKTTGAPVALYKLEA